MCIPGSLNSLGMMQRTKWGCVLYKFFINLFKDSCNKGEKDIIGEVLCHIEMLLLLILFDIYLKIGEVLCHIEMLLLLILFDIYLKMNS